MFRNKSRSKVRSKNQTPVKFRVVSPARLVTLSMLTLGIYLAHWSYKNWREIYDYNGSHRLHPFLGIFYFITSYYLFKEIRAQRKNYDDTSVYAEIAALFVLILTPFGLAIVPTIFMQRHMVTINEYGYGSRDRVIGTTWSEVLVVIIGLIFMWWIFFTDSPSSNSYEHRKEIIAQEQNWKYS